MLLDVSDEQDSEQDENMEICEQKASTREMMEKIKWQIPVILEFEIRGSWVYISLFMEVSDYQHSNVGIKMKSFSSQTSSVFV